MKPSWTRLVTSAVVLAGCAKHSYGTLYTNCPLTVGTRTLMGKTYPTDSAAEAAAFEFGTQHGFQLPSGTWVRVSTPAGASYVVDPHARYPLEISLRRVASGWTVRAIFACRVGAFPITPVEGTPTQIANP